MKHLGGGIGNTQFGATRIGDQRARRSVPGNLREKVDGDADGQRNVDQVGIGDRRGELAGKRIVDRAARVSLPGNFSAIPSGHIDIRREFPQRKRE